MSVALNKLDRLKAASTVLGLIGEGLTNAANTGEGQDFELDYGVVQQSYQEQLQTIELQKRAQIEGQMGDVGMIASDSDAAMRMAAEDLAASFNDSKADGETFEVKFPYHFKGTLSEFAKNPTLTEARPKVPLLDKGEARFFLLSSEITQVQNTSPIAVNFTLDGAPISNVHACPIGSDTSNIVYFAMPHTVQPMSVDHVFYESGASTLCATEVQYQFHKTTQADIDASLVDPTPEEFFGPEDNSWKTNPAILKEFKANIEGMKAGGLFAFVKKNSAVGEYISFLDHATSNLPEDLQQIDTHYHRSAHEVNDYTSKLKEEVVSSPFNTVNNYVGKISRADGKSWTEVSDSLSDAERDDLLNGNHDFTFLVKHRLATFKADQ